MIKTYTTVQGDMWDSVAYKAMGTTAHVGLLMRKNREHIRTFLFPAGVELTIPEVPIEEEANDLLPPWKKVT